jgi:hypothetical protein
LDFLLVVPIEFLEDNVGAFCFGVEPDSPGDFSIEDDLLLELAFIVVQDEFFLKHFGAADDIVIVHDIDLYLFEGFGTSKSQVLVLPHRLISRRVSALLALQHLLASSHPHVAVVHITKGLGLALEFGSFEPKMDDVRFFFSEGSLEDDEAGLLAVEIEETPQGSFEHRSAILLGLTVGPQLAGRSAGLEAVEVGVEIDDAVAYDVVGGDVTVHKFEFEAPAEVLVGAVDYEPAAIVELGVGPSLLDYLPLVALVRKLHHHIGVHRRKLAGLVLDLRLHQHQLKYSEDSVPLHRFRYALVRTPTAHLLNT